MSSRSVGLGVGAVVTNPFDDVVAVSEIPYNVVSRE